MTQHLSEFKVNGKTDTSIKGLPRKEIEVLSPGDLLTLVHANRSFIVDRKELLVYDDFSQIPPVAMLWLTEIPFINTSPPQPQP